ncbi:MAG: hypothetical protein B0D92_04890 [Spirochaeta sp. LUC14_002_19_P3]|nr:MAG: hypothetical protein B0D92_04890 [Spirochaeta sp. LUC14_002_19_P3]
MANLAVISTIQLSPQARQPVFGGPSAFERALTWAKSIPDYKGTILLTNSSEAFPEEEFFAVIHREQWNEETLIGALQEAATLAEKLKPEAFFYAWGDCPLIDTAAASTLWELHYRYNAEYTFADGYPIGLTPEIISPRLPKKLIPLAAKRTGPITRSSIFDILCLNINAFDIETHLAPEDLRMQRVFISCDTRRNTNIAEALYAAGGTDAESLCRIIPENPLLLRSLPAYFPIQITDNCPQACAYCPFSRTTNPMEGHNFMEKEAFADLWRRIAAFAGDAVISPSLWGEPSSHPRIGDILHDILDKAPEHNIRVLIETSGIGWNTTLLKELAYNYADGRLLWIVSLDAADETLYRSLRGEGMAEAEQCARTLAELFGKNSYIQAVRMKTNEENLEEFYKKWKNHGGGAIIQKHDSYGGLLENLQPADLSPLDRFPCWHLKRDMPILIDGTVPACRTDMGRREPLGNAFSESLERIWERGEELYAAHIRAEYPGPCAKCDEYCTFNF